MKEEIIRIFVSLILAAFGIASLFCLLSYRYFWWQDYKRRRDTPKKIIVEISIKKEK